MSEAPAFAHDSKAGHRGRQVVAGGDQQGPAAHRRVEHTQPQDGVGGGVPDQRPQRLAHECSRRDCSEVNVPVDFGLRPGSPTSQQGNGFRARSLAARRLAAGDGFRARSSLHAGWEVAGHAASGARSSRHAGSGNRSKQVRSRGRFRRRRSCSTPRSPNDIVFAPPSAPRVVSAVGWSAPRSYRRAFRFRRRSHRRPLKVRFNQERAGVAAGMREARHRLQHPRGQWKPPATCLFLKALRACSWWRQTGCQRGVQRARPAKEEEEDAVDQGEGLVESVDSRRARSSGGAPPPGTAPSMPLRNKSKASRTPSRERGGRQWRPRAWLMPGPLPA